MDIFDIDRVTQRQSVGAEELKRSILERLIYSVGKDDQAAVARDWFFSTALAARDHVVDAWMDTTRRTYREDAKRVYYLSVEFLIGRLLLSSLQNLGILEDCREALSRLGLSMADVVNEEPDAALGNGGLGRLAACYLDSMATMGLPGIGYGIRYMYGLFEQRFKDGWQVEHPEAWLRYGNPWEFPRPEVSYKIPFYGQVVPDQAAGWRHWRWTPGAIVEAMAYDMPVVGFGGRSINTLRLWSARPGRSLDLDLFNRGDYLLAVEERIAAEKLSWVLYPGDNTPAGKELRLRKEFFFTSASLQDILRRFHHHHGNFSALPKKVAIQLNDTHPAIGVAELMRLLVDEYNVGWDEAWELTQESFAYTNHTLLPEALETWHVGLFERVLPRHLRIIYDINSDFLHRSRAYRFGDLGKLARISLIDEHDGRRVRMGHLAFVGSHRVNGVSALHTELMKQTVFADLHSELPDRIVNVTNGITPRRWLLQANPPLARLVTAKLGPDWVRTLDRLQELRPLAADAGFRAEFQKAKVTNKHRLAAFVAARTGVQVDPASLFDVQVKRIHEYKRQLLNILQTVALYDEIRNNPTAPRVPVTKIFAGKAAPAYTMAKLIIKLINDVAAVVNNDPVARDLLRVVYVPNYNVSAAEAIIPGADLSEQISTAGLEASGTGNMKFALNGALTIGTLDGANVEISQAVGLDNIFIFGLTTEEVAKLRPGYDPRAFIDRDPALKRALDMIRWGIFSPDDAKRFHPIVNSLCEGGDHFLVCADFTAYREAHQAATRLFGSDPDGWTAKTIINTASMGWFSSDRAVGEYAANIWNVKPLAHLRPE